MSHETLPGIDVTTTDADDDLLSPMERAALGHGQAPFLWAVAAGRLLRCVRTPASVRSALDVACRGVTGRSALRLMEIGCEQQVDEIDERFATMAGTHGAPLSADEAWDLLGARDDLESVRRAMAQVSGALGLHTLPALGEDLERIQAWLGESVDVADGSFEAMSGTLLAILRKHPDDVQRARLAATKSTPSPRYRESYDHLVVLEYLLRGANRYVTTTDFQVGDVPAAPAIGDRPRVRMGEAAEKGRRLWVKFSPTLESRVVAARMRDGTKTFPLSVLRGGADTYLGPDLGTPSSPNAGDPVPGENMDETVAGVVSEEVAAWLQGMVAKS